VANILKPPIKIITESGYSSGDHPGRKHDRGEIPKIRFFGRLAPEKPYFSKINPRKINFGVKPVSFYYR